MFVNEAWAANMNESKMLLMRANLVSGVIQRRTFCDAINKSCLSH